MAEVDSTVTYYPWLEWYQDWATTKDKTKLRIGQKFCNDFISSRFEEMYYEEDHQTAILMIWEWMQKHSYDIYNMPDKLEGK